MKKRLFLTLAAVFVVAMFAGCTVQTDDLSPQIAPMELSESQQEILDLITRTGQEILLFDYIPGGMLNEMEVWVEIYSYGELQGEIIGLRMFGDEAMPINDGQLTIVINQYGNSEFRWTISAGGASVRGSWTADRDYRGRSFGAITESVPVTDGQEVILYMSKFTAADFMRSMNDLQHYLEHPEELAGYTYVHLIKARFSAER